MSQHTSAILEARARPQLNVKQSMMDSLKLIHQKENVNGDVFVTFTSVDKFGMYPMSHHNYNTPLGIYAYPLKYVIAAGGKVPYPDPPAPYLQIFKAKDFIEISQLLQYKRDIYDAIKHLYNIKEDIEEYKHNTCPNGENVCTPFARIWYTMYSYVRKNAIPNGLASRKILMAAGIKGIVDDGYSIIHDNEPTQAVFLDKSKLSFITRLDNDVVRKSESAERARHAFDASKLPKTNITSLINSIKANLSHKELEVIEDAYKTKDPELALQAIDILNIKDPVLLGYIAQAGFIALKYAKKYKTRFKQGEIAIVRDCIPRHIMDYVNIIDEEFELGEDKLAMDPEYAYKYARFLRRRFPKGEEAMFSHFNMLSIHLKESILEYYFFKYFKTVEEAEAIFSAYPMFARDSAIDYNKFRLNIGIIPTLEKIQWTHNVIDDKNHAAFLLRMSSFLNGNKVNTSIYTDPHKAGTVIILLDMHGVRPFLKEFVEKQTNSQGDPDFWNILQLSTPAAYKAVKRLGFKPNYEKTKVTSDFYSN